MNDREFKRLWDSLDNTTRYEMCRAMATRLPDQDSAPTRQKEIKRGEKADRVIEEVKRFLGGLETDKVEVRKIASWLAKETNLFTSSKNPRKAAANYVYRSSPLSEKIYNQIEEWDLDNTTLIRKEDTDNVHMP